MDFSDQLLEILKYVLPSVVVFITAYFVVKKFLEQQLRRQTLEMRLQQQGAITPIRLQAYERVILLLERISPNSLVMRTHKPNTTAGEFHQELLVTIRNEFDHNLTQQVYISRTAWEGVKRAKEETVKLINIAASKVNSNAGSIELSKIILDLSSQVERLPTQAAIDLVKEEIRTIF